MPRASRRTRRAAAALAAVASVLGALPATAGAAPPTCDVPDDFSVTVEAGQSYTFSAVPCSDPDGDALQIEVTRPPTHGTLSPPGTVPIDVDRTYIAGSPGTDVIGFRALAGGEASAEETVSITVTPAVLIVVVPAVSFTWDGAVYGRRGTLFQTLAIKGAPARSTVRIRCAGATCPRKRQRFTGVSGTVRLPRFTRTRLAPGTRIEAVVTAPGRVGVVKTLRVRRGRRPALTTRCIVPGETRRRSCDPGS